MLQMKYQAAGTPLVVIAGQSMAPEVHVTAQLRHKPCWAAVAAQSFERIHRSNP